MCFGISFVSEKKVLKTLIYYTALNNLAILKIITNTFKIITNTFKTITNNH